MSIPIRLLVTGSRRWTDREAIRRVLATLPLGSVVIHGGCGRKATEKSPTIGADLIAGEEAEKRGFKVIVERALWGEHADGWCRCNPRGRTCPSAGPRRNQAMIDKRRPTHYAAFPLAYSPGTHDCVRRCQRAGVTQLEAP